MAVSGALAIAALSAVSRETADSTCYGTPAHGRIENATRLPVSGKNFTAYSQLAGVIGRTYVHSKIRDVVVAAYHALEQTAPSKVFVYGETGWAAGGRFAPHRTHQNGLSVDFMVPVVNASGRSVPLPTSALNGFGYGIEFDKLGRFGEYLIDFEALAEHLYQLHVAASAQGTNIVRVIIDPAFRPVLFRTERGSVLQRTLSFMKRPAWVRHDDHYHVDFAIACQPMQR